MTRLTAKLWEIRSSDRVVRKLRFAGRELWWEIIGPSEALPPSLPHHDIAATALVFHAMHKGVSLHIEGAVSRSLLEGLEDLIACWNVWRPDLYKRIGVTADEEIQDDRGYRGSAGKAVVAFSGGLDATFTTWRHKNNGAGRRTRQLTASVLVHGVDIPLRDGAAFDRAAATAAETMRSIDVPLAVLRTNIKDEVVENWEMEFGTVIASCLRNWAGSVDTGLLGSDEDYNRLVFPWGGNPLTYAMLSSSDFRVVYDGAEFARSEKAQGVREWETGMRNLRVCWQGPQTGRNCGHCEKCIRTKMNFMAVGLPPPPSLAGEPTPREILSIRATNGAQLALLREILEIARARDISGRWLTALRQVIAKNELMNRGRELKPLRTAWQGVRRRIARS